MRASSEVRASIFSKFHIYRRLQHSLTNSTNVCAVVRWSIERRTSFYRFFKATCFSLLHMSQSSSPAPQPPSSYIVHPLIHCKTLFMRISSLTKFWYSSNEFKLSSTSLSHAVMLLKLSQMNSVWKLLMKRSLRTFYVYRSATLLYSSMVTNMQPSAASKVLFRLVSSNR